MLKLILGLLLVSLSVYYLHYSKTVLSFTSQPAPVVVAKRHNPPARLIINRSQIYVDVEPGEIINGVWKIAKQQASYLTSASFPGEGGNVVIYGHNTHEVFGKLHWLMKGDPIKLVGSDGLEHKYRVSEVKKVNPTQVEVVSPTNHEQLTIFTCTGLLDSQRLVVVAVPEL